MAGGFKFSIDFDSSAFKRGSDDASRSLDDLGRSLDDVARTDTTQAEAGVEGIGTAAQSSAGNADRLASEFDEAFQRVKRGARDTGTTLDESLSVDVDTEGPITQTQDMMNEIRSSITESMGELAGAFAENGFNMEDSIEGVAEVASEAAGALPGPWSLAGSALVTVAAGVYGEWKKRMENIAEDASAMYDDMLESGNNFVSNQFFQKRLQEFFDPMGESYDANMSKIDILADLGVPADQAARALVGYGQDAEVVLSLVDEKLDQNRQSIANGSRGYEGMGNAGTTALASVQAAIQDTKESTDIARRATDGLRDAVEDIPDEKHVRVRVGDSGSVRRTQREIENIRGASATVEVYADTSSADYEIGRFRGRVGRPITVPIAAGFIGAQGSFYP